MMRRGNGQAGMENHTLGGRSYADPIHHPCGNVENPTDPNASLIAAINALSAQIAAWNPGTGEASCTPANGQTVQFQTINLQTANTDLEVSIGSCFDFCTVFCDGPSDGISVKVRDQSATAIDLGKVRSFPIMIDVTKLFVTSDVRIGRTILKLGFSIGKPLSWIDTLDLPELAARLGALSNFDRRGQVIWQDDFAGTQLKWQKTITGGVADISLTGVNPLYGDQCVRIKTDAAVDDVATISRALWLPANTILGAEFSFRWQNGDDDVETEFQLELYTGVRRYLASIKLGYSSGPAFASGISYLNTAGADIFLIGDSWKPYMTDTWHKLKFIINTDDKKWVGLMIDNMVINMRTYNLFYAASAALPHTLLTVNHYSRNLAVSKVMHIGHAIMTQNEIKDIVGNAGIGVAGPPSI
jgi:hypothetical protein